MQFSDFSSTNKHINPEGEQGSRNALWGHFTLRAVGNFSACFICLCPFVCVLAVWT